MALDLPEIRAYLGHLLTNQSLAACVLVNKAWCASFSPFLYLLIPLHVHKAISLMNPSIQALRKNAHHIRHFRIMHALEPSFGTLDCVNLQVLAILFVFWDDKTCQYLKATPEHTQILSAMVTKAGSSLTQLELNYQEDMPGAELWNALSTHCPGLRTLHLHKASFDVRDMNAFWKVCSMLETLSVDGTNLLSLTAPPNNGPPLLPQLKSVSFNLTRDPQLATKPGLTLAFIQQCKSLESLEWHAVSYAEKDLCQLALDGNWPQLQSLVMIFSRMTDPTLATLLGTFPRLIKLHMRLSGFGPLSAKSLLMEQPNRLLCTTLQDLDISDCKDATGAMLHAILASCPALKVFAGDTIHVEDLRADDRPWICHGLESMEIFFDMEGFDTVEDHDRVYQQLSGLTRLQELNLDWKEGRHPEPTRGLLLLLNHGLERLAGLQRLKTLHVEYVDQQMCEEEVYWMMDHWKKLEAIHGVLNPDHEVQERYDEVLSDHGITLHWSG